MPIPDLKGELSRQEIIDAYAKWGWKKKITIDWIEIDKRQNSIIKKTFDINADAMPCAIGEDASYQLSFVQMVPSGIVWTCAGCRRTEGPLSFEAGGIRQIGNERVSLEEAWNTIKRTGQKKPLGMPSLSGREGLKIRQ